MKRSDAVLRILDKIEDPIRGRALYLILIKEPEGHKGFMPEGQEFWYADFPTMMETLVAEKLVHKFKVDNKVWYYIAKKGRKQVRPFDYQKLFKRQLYYWVQKLTYIPRWTDPNRREEVEECKRQIQELTELIEDGETYLYKRLVNDYAATFVRLYKDEYDSLSIKDLRLYIDKIIPPETFKKLFKRAMRRILRRDYKSLEWAIQQNKRQGYNTGSAVRRRNRLVELMNEFGPSPDSCEAALDKFLQKKLARKEICALCYTIIHNKEATEDAKLLEKYTGIKAGAVCCNCHANLVKQERTALGLKPEFRGARIVSSIISIDEFRRLLRHRDVGR